MHKVRKYPELHVWPAALPAHHVTRTADGLPVITAARTVVDLARHHTFREAVVLGESAMRRGFTTLAEIRQTAADCVGRPYDRRVVRVVAIIDDGTESVGDPGQRGVRVGQVVGRRRGRRSSSLSKVHQR